MKKRKLSLVLLSALIASSALLGACKKDPVDPTGSKEPAKVTKKDPLEKYATPIDQTSCRVKMSWMTYDEGEDENNNVWSKAIKEHLNINLTQKFTAINFGAPFDEKVNLAITTDDLPDMLPIYTSLFFRLVENGKAADLTDIYPAYVAPEVQKMLEVNDKASLKSATYDDKEKAWGKGKLYGIGFPNSDDGRSFLWLRKDWLDKLKLQPPKTLDELYAVAKAFATKDPNGNGKNDEYGIPLDKDFFGPNVGNLFNAYRLYPRDWEVKNGQLQRTDINPEMKTVLKKLAELYKDGTIAKDFTVKAAKDIDADYVAGKVGIYFGGAKGGGDVRPRDSWKADPKADWRAYDMPTIDGKTVNSQIGTRTSNFVAASYKNKNPEAIIKMLNFEYYVNQFDPRFVKDNTFNTSPKNNPNAWSKPIRYTEVNMDTVNLTAISKAIETKDPSKLNITQKSDYDKYMNYVANKDKDLTKTNQTEEGLYTIYNPEYGSYKMYLSDKYKDAKWLSPNSANETPAWVESGQDLHNQVAVAWIKAVTTGDVDKEFDAWVNYWNTQGGKKATEELNKWYSENKK